MPVISVTNYPNQLSIPYAMLHISGDPKYMYVIRRTASFTGSIAFKLFCFLSFVSAVSCNLNLYTIVQTRSNPYQSWQKRIPTNTRITNRQHNTSHWDSRRYEVLDDPLTVPRAYRYNQQSSAPPQRSWQPSMYQYNQNARKITTHMIQNLPVSFESRGGQTRYGGFKQFNSFPPWYANKYRRYPPVPSDEPWTGSKVDAKPWSYHPRCRSCGRAMLQDSYCSDDIVLRLYVQQEISHVDSDRLYLVYVFEVFKDARRSILPNQYIRITYNCDRLRTGPIIGETYVVTGLYTNNVPSVDSCSWKALWNHVTRQQKRYLKTKYRQLCGVCKIERVLRFDVQQHKSEDTCYVALTPNSNELACRDRFSVCRYQRSSKTCAFNHRPLYDVCEKWFS